MISPRCRRTMALPYQIEMLLAVIFALSLSEAFYLPGLAPVNYCKSTEILPTCKSDVTLYVNRLNTEESVIPYEYHHFDFCLGKEENSPVENLGQVVFGERIRPGPYRIQFREDVECAVACRKNYTGGNVDSDRRMMVLKKGISLNYQHHWIVDNMPVTWCYQLETGKQYCSTGFPMGCLVRPDGEGCAINAQYNRPLHYYPFNHVDLEITFHSGKSEDWGMNFGGSSGRIISAKVTPRSLNHADPNKPTCGLNEPPLAIRESSLKSGEFQLIVYTYSVKFTENDNVKWSSRWDYILESMPHTNIS